MSFRRCATFVSLVCIAVALVGCGATDQDDGGARLLGDTGQSPDAFGADAGDVGSSPSGVAVLGDGSESMESVNVQTIANGETGLARPTDLEFNPDKSRQLWIVNHTDSSTVVMSNVGTDDQSAQKYDGLNSQHFMAQPAALAFGQTGAFATAQQTDEKTQDPTPADFMGPVLWSADLSIFDSGHGGHLDMLHNSPLSSGIAWNGTGHQYWIFDGYHSSITKYDFGEPHPPGGTDHTDGVVRRYIEGKVSAKDNVPAHMDMKRQESATKLYIADTGNNRIAVLQTDTGEVGERIYPNYDRSSQRKVTGATVETLIDGSSVGLQSPSGLELHDEKLFVSDSATSTIYAFDLEGKLLDKLDVSSAVSGGASLGMAFGPDGGMFIATGDGQSIVRISPKQ
jgi:sugar lactone lactonase YvrE